MKVYSGQSNQQDSGQAIAESTQKWPKDFSPDLILVFHSVMQNSAKVAEELQRLFPKSKIAGCTTSGEHLNGRHYNGSLVLTGIHSPEIRWHVEAIENIKNFTVDQAKAASNRLLAGVGVERDHLAPDRQFSLCFIDGLSMKEEAISALMAEALDGIPLLGGSAGDDLKFARTDVIAGGKAYTNAAVFVIADSKTSFRVIKHQHFIKTPKQLVITRCDTANRRVYEMDGRPALEAYAAVLGMEKSKVTGEITFANPVTFRVNNEIYVRSIQKIESDDSIVFYCGVDEGMVVEIGGHEDMKHALSRDLKSFNQNHEKSELFIVCNCILRALETKNHNDLGELITKVSPNIIGFDTYGEQLNGLHINQTLVGIALGRAA